MNTPTVEIVVAKYNEDVSWTRNLKYPVFLYDKSSNPVEKSIPLPNVGREAHTYLYHIVSHYDTLPDLTIFLQGRVYDHALKLPNATNEKCAEWINSFVFPIEFQGFLQDLHNYDTNHEYLHVYRTVINNRKIFVKESTPYDKSIAGAQYIVPKANILARPLSFYKKLLKMSETNQQLIDSDEYLCAWTLERMWPFIFDPSIEIQPSFLSESSRS